MSDRLQSSASLRSEVDRLREEVARLRSEAAESCRREKELAEAKRQAECFLKISPVWFWEMDEELRFTYFSPNFTAFTGLPPEWHHGKTREEIGAPDTVSSEEWQTHLDKLKRREPYTDFIFQRHGPDGVRWICSSGEPIFDRHGTFKGYRGTGSDVTEKVLAGTRVNTLHAAIEQLEETFVVWDQEDKLLVCNERFRKMNAGVLWTTKPGTHIETHFRAALLNGLYPEARGREESWFRERMHRYRNPGPPFELNRQNGQCLLIHEQRVSGGATVTISTDITAAKTYARAEQEKAAILETAFRSVPDGIQVLDRDLNLVFWNEQLFTVLDLERNAVLKAENPRKAFFRLLAERGEYGDGDPDDLVEERDEYIKSMTPVQFVRQLTTGKWIEGRGVPIDGGGGYVTVYRDVTERRRLDRLQREFVSTVSHELRTPLTSIFGSLALMTRCAGEETESDQHDLINIAHKNCERLVGLVDDILDMDKIGAGKMDFRMTSVLISDLIRNSIELNAGYGEQYGVSLQILGQVPEQTVTGDPDRLLQVLTNLISNAVKYSPRDSAVEIAAETRSDTIRVSVRDYGPGIPKEFENRVFERFSRVDSTDARSVPGTGLGLFISKEIVAQHDGAIGFEPANGRGTVFYFDLPIAARIEAAAG